MLYPLFKSWKALSQWFLHLFYLARARKAKKMMIRGGSKSREASFQKKSECFESLIAFSNIQCFKILRRLDFSFDKINLPDSHNLNLLIWYDYFSEVVPYMFLFSSAIKSKEMVKFVLPLVAVCSQSGISTFAIGSFNAFSLWFKSY